jgi:Leucine-rich repeat (LRR) protein
VTPQLKLQAGGTLVPGRHVYIERPEDKVLLDLLLEGQYVNILTPRQMGKSSLMVRTLYALRERGIRTASVDLAAELGEASNSELYFRALLARLARELLGIRFDAAAFFSTHPQDTPGQLLQRFSREAVCAQASQPIVVFLDEIESTLKFPFTDTLFTAIRGMYNERALEPGYQRITFCLLGVATPNELIKDRRTTAYNVGTTLELRDFDSARDDLTPLIEQLSADPEQGKATLQRVIHWTAGQPYLTTKICAELKAKGVCEPQPVDNYVESTFVSLDRLGSDVHFEQILRFVETRLSYGIDALEVYRRVLIGERIREQTTPAHLELKLSGLVKRNEEGCLVVRNPIYARLFDEKWIASTKPAQNIARYRRRLQAAAVFGTVVLLAAGFLGYGFYQERIVLSGFEQFAARNIQISGDREQGFRLSFPRETTSAMLADALRGLPAGTPIASVRLSGTQVADLSALESLTSLQTLDLSFTQVANVSPLKSLTSLETLALSDTQVADLSPLKSLTSLQTLDLYNTQVADLSPLKSLTSLQRLDLFGTRVADLSPLKSLTSLQRLSLSFTQVADLSPLKSLTSLQTLTLSGTRVADLSPLESLPSLQMLRLSRTKVADFSPLKSLTSLQMLSLSGTKVADFSPLKGLTSLQELDLSGTQVTDLSLLKSLTSLQKLDLSGSQVADLSLLKSLTSLQELNLSGTRVADLSPLKSLTSLQRLDLSGTRVADLSPLGSLTSLRELDISNTRVTSLGALQKLKSLEIVALKGTEISDQQIEAVRAALYPPKGDLKAIERASLGEMEIQHQQQRSR